MNKSVSYQTLFVALLFFMSCNPSVSASETSSPLVPEPSSLVVVWTSGDPDVAHRVALMYTHAAQTNGWFKEVHLIVWGPSQRILVGDKDLQEKIAKMQEDGVIVEACIACAQSFGIVEELRGLNLPVRGMGGPLTSYLKSPEHTVITF
ncbi:MAG: DsrE family protein [Puniceicoccaceae bacterium]